MYTLEHSAVKFSLDFWTFGAVLDLDYLRGAQQRQTRATSSLTKVEMLYDLLESDFVPLRDAGPAAKDHVSAFFLFIFALSNSPKPSFKFIRPPHGLGALCDFPLLHGGRGGISV